MLLSNKIRWSLIAVIAALALLFGPLALIMAGNLGGGLLDLLLNRRPTTSELIGSYKLTVPWGTSTLEINAGGTFHQEIVENRKAGRSMLGHWHASDDLNFLAVDFRPFGMVWDDDHERETNICGINFYKPHFGATYGMINDDLGEKFVRQQGGNNDQ